MKKIIFAAVAAVVIAGSMGAAYAIEHNRKAATVASAAGCGSCDCGGSSSECTCDDGPGCCAE